MRTAVVGLDGTDASQRALEWAAEYVGASGSIHAVTGVSHLTEFGIDLLAADPTEFVNEVNRDLATRWTQSIRHKVARLDTHVLEEPAAEALSAVATAWDADAIVIGAHVRGHAVPTKLGRTTRHLLRDLMCPLVVVPIDSNLHELGSGPVVVGIGHGEATESAVWWASELADADGLSIGLVRATGDAPMFQANGLLDLVGYYLDASSRAALQQGDIERLASYVQENSAHDLSIETTTRPGLPAVRLVEASERAALLVIGQHRSAVVGSRHTPQPLRYALVHARCPIAIIPEAAVHVG